MNKSYEDIEIESAMEEAGLTETKKVTVEVMQERLKASEALRESMKEEIDRTNTKHRLELEKAQNLNIQLIDSISNKIDDNIKADKLKESLEFLTQQNGVIQISVKKFPIFLHDKLTEAKDQSKIGAVTSYMVQATLEKMIREDLI